MVSAAFPAGVLAYVQRTSTNVSRHATGNLEQCVEISIDGIVASMWRLRIVQCHDDRSLIEGIDDLHLEALRRGGFGVDNEVKVVGLRVRRHHHDEHLDRVGLGEPFGKNLVVIP